MPATRDPQDRVPSGSAAEGCPVACCLPSGVLSARLLGLLGVSVPWPGVPGAWADGFGEDGPVTEQPGLSFAGLLRRLRDDAGLTQEELAEAASLSPRSVSDLERGVNLTARHETARLLAGALGLTGPQRALFEAAARGRAPASQVLAAGEGAAAAAATRTLPRDIASFTGRVAELAQLAGAVSGAAAADGGVVGIHAIGGMAGVGKTTFAVHAAHRLAGAFPDGQFFLPLHAHTPGQRPVEPVDALASLLLSAGVGAQQIPPGVQARAARWRDYLAGKKVLLLLDDAACHEQVTPLLPGTAGSLVLVTSRRRLTALEDAVAISLDTLTPGEAATLLARLAGRPGLGSGDGPAGRDHPAVRVPAAGDRDARPPAASSPGLDRGGPGRRPGHRGGPAGADARGEPVRGGRVRPVLPGPDGRPAAAVPPPGRAPGQRHRRVRRGRPGRHRIWPPPAATWTACTITTCWPSPPAAGTGCTTCSPSTPARWRSPATRPTPTRRPGGCWITTCTPPRPPASTSTTATPPPPGRRPANRRPSPRCCPRPRGHRPGWTPSGRTWTRRPATPPEAGGRGMSSRSPPPSAVSCSPEVTGISPRRCTGPPWPPRARPGTGPGRPVR